MNILNKLTIKHLKMNKKRTIVTIIGILLSTALMVGIGLLFSTVRDYMIKEVVNTHGSYHASITNISSKDLDILKSNKNVKTIIYEKGIGFAKFHEDYIYISGATNEYLKELEVMSGRLPKNENEIIISEMVASNDSLYKIGNKVSLEYGYRVINKEKQYLNSEKIPGETLKITDKKEYTIVGIAEISYDFSYEDVGYPVYTLSNNLNEVDHLKTYITYKKVKDIYNKTESLAKMINKDLNDVCYNDSLLTLYGESKYDNMNGSFGMIIAIILTVISIGCIIVIYNSFAISVMERKKQFGLFASIGATKKQLQKTVFFESIIVGTIGITLGILSGLLGISIVIAILNELLASVFILKLSLVVYPLFVIIPIIFMILVVFFSAFLPAFRASRVSPITAIRQNDDIKIKSKKIKTNKVIKKIFGMEGVIALKNIKRNKKKYRITVLSLIVSIVLFISFSSFLEYGNQSSESYAGIPKFDLIGYYYSNGSENSSIAFDNLEKIGNHKSVTEYSIIKETGSYYTDSITDSNFNSNVDSDIYRAIENNIGIKIVNVDDQTYDRLIKDNHLKDGKPILLNYYYQLDYSDSSRKLNKGVVFKNNIKTINLCNDISVNSDSKVDTSKIKCNIKTFTKINLLNEIPSVLNDLLYDDSIILIVNDDIYKELPNSGTDIEYTIVLNSNDVSGVETLFDTIISENPTGGHYYYTNLKEAYKLQKNLILAIKILLYGFISLVTLIGITSVFNTINTSIALRRKEFAMLRSMGLTPKGFNKMLRFESLFVGLKALIYSIPFSLIIICFFHLTFNDMVAFNSLLIPWKAVIGATIGVFVIIFLTMTYATSKIKHENILDAIREENI